MLIPEKREESKDPEGALTALVGQRVKTWSRGGAAGAGGQKPPGFRWGRGCRKMHPRQVFIHGDRAGTTPSFDSLESETGWRGQPVACKNLSKSLVEKKCHPTLQMFLKYNVQNIRDRRRQEC